MFGNDGMAEVDSILIGDSLGMVVQGMTRHYP